MVAATANSAAGLCSMEAAWFGSATWLSFLKARVQLFDAYSQHRLEMLTITLFIRNHQGFAIFEHTHPCN
jgi:Ni,Fe-hydrogenase I cytochrome b subunit